MFESEEKTHTELIAWILASRKKLDPLTVGEAFAVSLSARRMDARSVLGSYSHALHLAKHAFEPDPEETHRPTCLVCGASQKGTVDISSRNFRRLKWAGNVEQGDLEYIAVDLQLFAGTKPPKASEEDRETLRQTLDAVRKLPAKAGLGDLNNALTGLFPATKHERQVVLEILGYAGVLQPRSWPSFLDGWTAPNERPCPRGPGRAEWQYPVNGWSGKDGVNEKAVKFWFPWAAKKK
jgi:hypothetical protein